jgi:two-component system, NarL family, sensor kinase
MQTTKQTVVTLLLVATFLILLMVAIIAAVLYFYRRRQHRFHKEITAIKAAHDRELMQTQLEMQEQTFQHISQEIHDNIGQVLTLAKLHLNTLNWNDITLTQQRVSTSVEMITRAISELRGISRSLNSDIILQQGLLKALDEELARLKKLGLYEVNLKVTGEAQFIASEKERIVFRIIQEAITNIIRHALATTIILTMDYQDTALTVCIKDNGQGFDIPLPADTDTIPTSSGLTNMVKRAAIISGNCLINSTPGRGTEIIINIPY